VPVDASLISFNSATRTISVLYTDTSNFADKEGTYTIKVTAQSPYTSTSFSFVLTVLNPCKTATKSITLPWSSFSYNIFDATLQKSWTSDILKETSSETTTLCGDWQFDVTMQNGDPLIAAFTKDLVAKTLVTASSDTSLASPQLLTFFAWQGLYKDQAMTQLVTATILNPCNS